MQQYLIDSFLESALNPQGRFRTLDNIFVETDSRDCPIFYVGQRDIVFRAYHNKNRVTLTVPIKYSPEEREIMAQRAFDTQMGKPFLVEGRYLKNEMLVFDSTSSTSERFDVLIQTANDPIADFVRKNSARSKLKAVRTALESVARAAEFLDREGIVHGSLSLRNLCLDDDASLAITDYPLSLSLRFDRQNDNFALLTVGIMLYLSGCEPKLYQMIGAHGNFTQSKMILNRRHVAAVAEFYGMEPLVRALKQTDNDLSREMVNHRLNELADAPFRPLPLLCDMVGEMSGSSVAFSTIERMPHSTDRTLTIDFAKCQTVAPIQDTVVRYRYNDYWGYADRNGRKIKINKPLLGAYDFYEGRAVVHTAEGYGLIDREGRWIMSDSWSDMIWYGEQNVVAACDPMCKWALYNRCGERISEVVCDALCDCNEGIIVARKGLKYGYLTIDGRRLTDFLYDEAYGFSDGLALVCLGGRRYHIDRSGHEVTEKQSKAILQADRHFDSSMNL